MNIPTTTHDTREQLLTTACSFYHFSCSPNEKSLMQVLPGAPAVEALTSVECLLGAAINFCDRLIEENKCANEVYGIRFLVEAAKSLSSAAVYSVEFGNRQGGGQ